MSEDDAEAKAAFHLRMRTRGIHDLDVLRAFEKVPRRHFVPPRFVEYAARDVALPIACGQTMPAPSSLARMIAALAVEATSRVLEIGAGTGYASAILANLATEVFALDRFQSLATAAQARITELGFANAVIVWGDGLRVSPAATTFDRIIVDGLLKAGVEPLLDRLADPGILVCGLADAEGPHLVKLIKADGALTRIGMGPCRLQAIVPGLAATL